MGSASEPCCPALNNYGQDAEKQRAEPGRGPGRTVPARALHSRMSTVQTLPSRKKTRPKMAGGRSDTKDGAVSGFDHGPAGEDEVDESSDELSKRARMCLERPPTVLAVAKTTQGLKFNH